MSPTEFENSNCQLFFFFFWWGGGGGSGVGGRNFLVDFPDAKKDSDRDFFQVFM